MRPALWLAAFAACGDPAQQPTHDQPPTAQPASPTAALPPSFELGRPATADEIAAWDIDVNPSWVGLPAGRGSVAEGRALYAVKCAVCHAPSLKGGQGFTGPNLVATEPLDGFDKDYKIPRAIGNWWPHASTLFDYVRRAMPQTAPGSLTADETYALVAFLLAENLAVPADFVADADTIKTVTMPTRVKFVVDDRESTAEFR